MGAGEVMENTQIVYFMELQTSKGDNELDSLLDSLNW